MGAGRRSGRGGRRKGFVVRGGKQQGRRGGVNAKRGRQQGRRGRTHIDPDAASSNLNAVYDDADLDVAAADANADGEEAIYNGCDPATNIGGFLIQKLWRKKCVEL